MTVPLTEVQVDGLVGPTHHFGGLSSGNLASQAHGGWRSRPRAAARQGLAKMRAVLELGMVQVALPPLPRPDLALLRACGLGEDAQTSLAQAAAHAPYLLQLASSSAFMWTANAATVVPGVDSSDGRTHVVAANLVAMSHRAREGTARAAQLRRLFRRGAVAIHEPLPALPALGDEGAANHTRLWAPGVPAVHLFVHGRVAEMGAKLSGEAEADAMPTRFPARQTLEASQAVARCAHLPEARVVHARQHPAAIDAGAFHNDVVMVGDGDHLLIHERALVDQGHVLQELRRRIPSLVVAQVGERDLSLSEAVRTYLFNSQLLSTPHGRVLLAPEQASEGPAGAIIQRLLREGFLARVVHLDLGESMANGGGPACLRLRLPLAADELADLVPGVVMTPARLGVLEHWVDRHYREELSRADLADPQLWEEGHNALVDLERLLALDVTSS